MNNTLTEYQRLKPRELSSTSHSRKMSTLTSSVLNFSGKVDNLMRTQKKLKVSNKENLQLIQITKPIRTKEKGNKIVNIQQKQQARLSVNEIGSSTESSFDVKDSGLTQRELKILFGRC